MLYTHPSDQQLTAAVLSLASGTEDPDYPLANLLNGNPARPAKFAETDIRIVVDFGVPVSLDAVALIHTNLDALETDLSVQWQGNSANSWVTPPLDLAFTIAPATLDGYVPGRLLDLTSEPTRTYRYWSLSVANNPTPVILGQLLAYATLRTLLVDKSGATRSEARPMVDHRTAYGISLRYDYGVTQRLFAASVRSDDAPSVRAWFADARQRPHVIVPEPIADGEAWLVRWRQDGGTLASTLFQPAVEDFALTWEELSRGRPWL